MPAMLAWPVLPKSSLIPSRTGRKTGVKERVFKGPEKLRIQSAERIQYPSRAKSGSSGSFGRSMKATGFQAYPFPHLATFFPASRVREWEGFRDRMAS